MATWKMKEHHSACIVKDNKGADWGQDDAWRIRIRWSAKLGLELKKVWYILNTTDLMEGGSGMQDAHTQIAEQHAQMKRVCAQINERRTINLDHWEKVFNGDLEWGWPGHDEGQYELDLAWEEVEEIPYAWLRRVLPAKECDLPPRRDPRSHWLS